MKKIVTIGIVLLLAILLIMFVADKLDKPAEEQPGNNNTAVAPGDYFPLTQGSTWEYEGEGNEYAAFDREVVYVKGNLAQLKEDNGGTVMARVFKTTDNTVTSIFNQGEEYTPQNLLDREPNEQSTILMSPLAVGTKWEEAGVKREIVDIATTVETPAGVFKNCIKVKIVHPGDTSTVYEYFAKGVGTVKEEFISGDTRVTSTLKSYSIK
ncbi:MAG: TapB family protein [Bacillota bacterium]